MRGGCQNKRGLRLRNGVDIGAHHVWGSIGGPVGEGVREIYL